MGEICFEKFFIAPHLFFVPFPPSAFQQKRDDIFSKTVAQYSGRIAHCDSEVGDRFGYYAASADHSTDANVGFSQYGHVVTDPAIVAQGYGPSRHQNRTGADTALQALLQVGIFDVVLGSNDSDMAPNGSVAANVNFSCSSS